MHEARAEFCVDTEKFTPEMGKATLEFFDWEYDEEADPVDEVMKKYAIAAISEATRNMHNTNGVIRDFEQMEGFAPVNGSVGLNLLYVVGYEFQPDKLEFSIKYPEILNP